MKRSIRTKIIFFAIILASIVTLVLSFLNRQMITKNLKNEMEEKVNALLDNFVSNSIYGMLTFNKEELTRLAENMLSQKDICSVEIIDKDGVSIIKLENDTKNDKSLRKEFLRPIVTIQQNGKLAEDIVMNLEKNGKEEIIGTAKITVSLNSLNQKIAESNVVSLKIGIFALLLSIFFIWFIVNKYIISPIKKLTFATQKVANGDLSYRIKVDYDDEFGILVKFFNTMIEKLQISLEKNLDYSKNLEKMVEEKTKELSETQKKLYQSDKLSAIGQLAGGVAHEINNPMGVILGFAQAVVKDIKENDPLYMPLKSIEREAIRCKKLVGDLLTFSRAGKTQKEPSDINELIENTLSLISTQTRIKGIEIIKEYGMNLPQINLNRNQVQQVIVNICNNAIDAMPEGGKLTIKTVLNTIPTNNGTQSQFIEISISDTGVGMTEEVKKKLFEPFFTTKEVGKGTGLGLPLVYEIIQKHNGTIDVESEVGKGTCFKIKIPVE
ncbi:MAG: ATP-binding protein [Endomicrobiia bacterium]